MKRLIVFSLIILLGLYGVLMIPAQKAAATVTFDKNFLIDDGLFTDTDSMSVVEIQAWLETNGGTLLANWVDDVHMRRPSDNCVVHHATGMTAAEVIYEAATAWNAQVYNASGCAISGAYWGDPGYSNYTLQTVSPKVLLVMLQKEQSLISANGTYSTSSNSYKDPPCCSSNEYKLARAMGYGVPDSGSINEKYLGFYNQINWAAWQLRFNYERSAGNTSWDGVDYITYTGPFTEGVFKACGTCSAIARSGYYTIDGSPLYMDNRATAALYYYTPHTYPGFYGNYNFVQFYSDWFGSIRSYKAELVSQDTTNSVRTGERVLSWVKFQNTGSTDWYDDVGVLSAPPGSVAVRLVTTKNYMRTSDFGEEWGASKNIANETFGTVYGSNGTTIAANQHLVKPGQIVKINFFISTTNSSLTTGNYSEWLRLATTDDTLINPAVEVPIQLEAIEDKAELVSQDVTETVVTGDRVLSWVKLKNTGNTNWLDSVSAGGDDYMRLVTSKPLHRASEFGEYWGVGKDIAADTFVAVYKSDGKTLTSNQHVVKPGEIVKLYFFLSTSNSGLTNGQYTENLRLEKTDGTWLDPTIKVRVNLEQPKPAAELVGKDSLDSIATGERALHWVKLKNTGNVKWYDADSIAGAPASASNTQLITTKNVLRSSDFGVYWGVGRNIPNDNFGKVYGSDGKTLSANQDVVKPGQIVKIDFFLSTDLSLTPGTYTEWLRLAEADGTIINPAIKVDVVLE